MRLYSGLSAGLVSGAAILLASGSAFAQDAAAPIPATTAAPAATATPEAAPQEEPAPEPEAEPAPEPEPEMETAEEESDAAIAGNKKVEVEETVKEEEPGGLNFMLFGDAYATMQTSQVGSASPGHRAYASNFIDGTGTAVAENGFSLSFIGLDVSYEGEGWGVTTSLRFGPSVPLYYAADPILGGIGSITQGFVTWNPMDSVSLDFGQFGTIFGAEVAESWMNLNYTRGGLYYAMQPFWHTGLRASVGLAEGLTLKAMVVNDANRISLENSVVQGAVQLGYETGDFAAYLGTLQTLGESSNSGFDRFVDLVATYAPGDFTLVFNGDLNVVDNGGGTFYGLSLAAGYQFIPMFGAAVRGEFLDPDADTANNEIVTGTVTLDLKPVDGSENFVIRWDNRIEGGPNGLFADGGGAPSDLWFSSTVGVVAHTDGLF